MMSLTIRNLKYFKSKPSKEKRLEISCELEVENF